MKFNNLFQNIYLLRENSSLDRFACIGSTVESTDSALGSWGVESFSARFVADINSGGCFTMFVVVSLTCCAELDSIMEPVACGTDREEVARGSVDVLWGTVVTE